MNPEDSPQFDKVLRTPPPEPMSARQISSRITRDLKKSGATLGGGQGWGSRVFPNETQAHVFPGRGIWENTDKVMENLKALGYSISDKALLSYTVTHPDFLGKNE